MVTSCFLLILRHLFADGPVLGYVCPCCVTFLLTEPFLAHRPRISGPMSHRFYFITLETLETQRILLSEAAMGQKPNAKLMFRAHRSRIKHPKAAQILVYTNMLNKL